MYPRQKLIAGIQDARFILALVLLLPFVGGCVYLAAIGNMDMLKSFAGILGTPTGTIIGFYFSQRREEIRREEEGQQ